MEGEVEEEARNREERGKGENRKKTREGKKERLEIIKKSDGERGDRTGEKKEGK